MCASVKQIQPGISRVEHTLSLWMREILYRLCQHYDPGVSDKILPVFTPE